MTMMIGDFLYEANDEEHDEFFVRFDENTFVSINEEYYDVNEQLIGVRFERERYRVERTDRVETIHGVTYSIWRLFQQT